MVQWRRSHDGDTHPIFAITNPQRISQPSSPNCISYWCQKKISKPGIQFIALCQHQINQIKECLFSNLCFLENAYHNTQYDRCHYIANSSAISFSVSSKQRIGDNRNEIVYICFSSNDYEEKKKEIVYYYTPLWIQL